MAKPDAPALASGPPVARLRIDRWLWAARFYRTRSLAAAAVDAGQVRVGGERVKPARAVHAGDSVSIRKAGFEWQVEVTAVDSRRGSATEAARLYRETETSLLQREEARAAQQAAALAQPRLPGRPSKRERRKLQEFLDEP